MIAAREDDPATRHLLRACAGRSATRVREGQRRGEDDERFREVVAASDHGHTIVRDAQDRLKN